MTTATSHESSPEVSDQEDQDIILPETQFAGPYKSRLLSLLPAEALESLSHVNCSYLSHYTGRTPSLASLKSHAQSLCALIGRIDLTDSTITSNAFDFLADLTTPYQTDSSIDHLPLNSVKNSIASIGNTASGDRAYFQGCPIKTSAPQHVRYLEHANEILETIDEMFIADGGLLATLPPPNTPERASSDKTLLGQLLAYISQITARISELEIDVVRMRDVLASEAIAPKVLSSSRALQDGIPLAFPQDQYVLTDLDPALWTKLNTLLTAEEVRNAALQAELDARTRPQASRTPMDNDNDNDTDDADVHAAVSTLDPSRQIPYRRAAVIDITSRLYRLPGQETLFLIPGFGEHPNTEATRALESRPFVAALPRRPAGIQSRDVGATKRLREELAEASKALDRAAKLRRDLTRERDYVKAANDRLDVRLAETKDELDLWREGRLVRDDRGNVRKVPGAEMPRQTTPLSDINETAMEDI